MAISQSFPISSIDALLEAVPKIISEEIIRAFSYLGEQCVKRIRDRAGEDSWFDQTGNLRSSIGYAVIESGRKIIESAFPVVKKGTEGAEEGRKMIDELASKYADTYAIVVVAGMEYAEYVEAMKGKDVLASTEIWAKSQMQTYIDKALQRADKRIAALQKKLGL